MKLIHNTLFASLMLSLVACGGGDDSNPMPPASTNTLPNLITASYMLDVDKDGDLDLILGTQGDSNHSADILLLNDGTGSFKIKKGAFPDHHLGTGGATVNIASADFNGDGNPDIIASTNDAREGTFDDTIQLQLYFGNGDGTFSDATTNISNGLLTEYPEWIRVADFDTDGHTDFLITSNGCSDGVPTTICHGGRIYRNDGSGKFTVATIISSDAKGSYSNDKLTWLSDGGLLSETLPSRIALDVFIGDLNNNGKIDLVAPNGYAGGAIASFINTSTPGKLSFNIVYSANQNDVYSTTLVKNGALLDIDQDGFLDMVASTSISGSDGTQVSVHAFINQADGSFVQDDSKFVSPIGVEHARQWLVDDFNQDGKDDFIIADHGFDAAPFPGEKNRLVFSNNAGLLEDVTANNLSTLSGFTHGVSSGDLNGDGFPDLFLNNASTEPNGFFSAEKEARLWINQGDGHFVSQGLGL